MHAYAPGVQGATLLLLLWCMLFVACGPADPPFPPCTAAPAMPGVVCWLLLLPSSAVLLLWVLLRWLLTVQRQKRRC
jgi:hypothetical protein